jgi:ABC-type transport system involved in cytochrome bd biosynthesis fused ATPase/permease subunit
MFAGCTLLSFQRPLRLFGGIRRPLRMDQAGACPRGTGEYSALARVCLGGTQAEAPEAALSRLQDLAVELSGGDVERIRGQRLAV